MAAASMSQSSTDIAPSADLLALAASRSVDDRHRLMLGVVALCKANPPTDGCAPALSDIFLTLARDAEARIRQTLAEQLADVPWAPRALLDLLMLDEIDIARPVIARSPLMRDEDLLRILVDATLEHQVEVARRPHISGRVADAVIDMAQPAPMAALAANTTAEISEAGLGRLIEHARRIAALRSPLSRHPRLNQKLAMTLYAMVGDALRTELQARFVDAGPALPAAIASAIETAASKPRSPAMTVLLASSSDRDGDRDEMDRRLVGKLQMSGQLKAGFLVRAVREKQIGLFEHGLSALSGFPLGQVRQAIRRAAPDALYLACAAVGIDRAVFPTLLKEMRALTGGLPGDEAAEVTTRSLTPIEAGYAFRLLMETETGLPV
ncbi:MAG: DUF2336 domain-containing protein [Brevundimonas sp.]|uniref:DUF2336 domain-containing protein n=1 Tax=Brevundimonas sp. TaxID=1871086 RepID=UPI0040331D89